MADSKHDDLADALARLAEGDVAPSEHAPAPPVPATAAPKAVRPASTRSTAPKSGTAPVKPAEATPRPPAPVPLPRARPPAPTLGSAPAAPQAASAPVIRPIAPVTRKARPVAPSLGQSRPPEVPTTDGEVDGGQSTGLTGGTDPSAIIDDDDLMNIPAPDAQVFQPRPKANVADARALSNARKNLELRRTMIPVLLTSGVLMAVFASLKFVTGSDSVLAALPIWVPALLGVGAAILLALAVVNMLSVKGQMEKS